MKKSEIFAEVLQMVSDETEVEIDDILSDSRTTDVMDAKALLCYTLKISAGLSAANIISSFGGVYKKDFVYYHVRGFEDRCKQNKLLKVSYNKIVAKLKQNGRDTVA